MAVDYKALKSGGYMRQKQKDLFSVRLKVVGGNLTSDQMRTVTDAADKFGRGIINLTSRQGIEIHHVGLKDVDSLREFLVKGGIPTGVCGPRVRTVTACQGSEVCPSGCVDTMQVASALSDRYFGRELPHKFKFGVTGCQNNCLKAEENDMGVKGGLLVEWNKEDCTFCGICAKTCREGAVEVTDDDLLFDRSKCNHCGRCVKSCPTDSWKGFPGYILSFGGLFGNRVAVGRNLTPIVTDLEALYRCSDAALDFFAAHASPGERFRPAIERAGWEALSKQVNDALLAS